MAHPAIALLDSLVSAIAGQAFASGATVSWSKIPIENLESVADETRITAVLPEFDRTQVSRSVNEEMATVSISTHKAIDPQNEDTEIETLLGTSYDLATFLNDWDPGVGGWQRAPESDSDPVYSVPEIQRTGEFQSVVTQTFKRWV